MTLPPILIVDDKVELLMLFSAALRRLPYKILTAQDGDTAILLLQQYEPGLVLLDIAMPPPNGLVVLHYIRNRPQLAYTKVMIITAVPTLLSEADTRLADLVVVKPITPKALEQADIEMMGATQ